MDETKISSTSGWSSSPITNIAEEQLLTILLFLPIDSILSFAMTCKRFKSLSLSDPLWESICRKDWGQFSVDSLKPMLQTKHGISWINLYRQIRQLDSLSCHRILMSNQELPTPRASHSLIFVSNCLVLFGGGSEGGKHLDDTWIARIDSDIRVRLKWEKIAVGSPSGRFGHSCVAIENFIVLFGGINDLGARQNDVWIGQVSFQDSLSGSVTLSWRLLDVSETISPPPRGAHAACPTDDGMMMLIHGGIGMSGIRLDDTWVLVFSKDHHSGVWRELVTCSSPPSRSGHTLTNIGKNQIIMFGGRGRGYEVLNDVWLLHALSCEGEWHWVELLFDLQGPQGLVDLPRVGHSANLIVGRKLLIYGGEDSHRHRKNDFWVLDIGSSLLNMNPKRSYISKGWTELRGIGDKPEPRSFHRACTDYSGQYLYIVGGMVDCLCQPGGLPGLRFDGGQFLLEILLRV
ncbi:unnamed protein product [Cuscuta epithymum]|uniref:F-box domain-containing protein n=2 Tax=Cuscuta epithymum TaxID=186058 RepID=A0AAV0FPE6_9ASTE|nr:unnamed protein product [Cuscuta epithymum]